MGHDHPVAIRQEISGSNHFTGVEPPTAPTLVDGVYRFAAGATGGLVEPAKAAWYNFEAGSPLLVATIALAPPAGTTSWKIEVEDTDAKKSVILSGASAAPFHTGPNQGPVLLWGQKLLVTTSGGAGGAATLLMVLHRYGNF